MWFLEQTKSLIEVLSRGVEVAAALIIAVAAVEATLKAVRIVIDRSRRRGEDRGAAHFGEMARRSPRIRAGGRHLANRRRSHMERNRPTPAIPALRTALNYFLGKEIDKEASAERHAAESSLPSAS